MPAPKPRRASRAPLFPRRIERAYRTRIDRRNVARHRGLLRALAPLLERFAEDIDRTSRADADALDVMRRLLQVVGRYRVSFAEQSEPDPDALFRTGRQLDLFTTRRVTTALPIRPGASLPGGELLAESTTLIRAWTRQNVALIKTIDARYFDEIEGLIREGMREGTTTTEIASGIRRRFAVSRSRAKLIARDQIATLNSKITQEKQRRLGVRRYVWRTSQDERVRDEHAEREGRIFTWDTPPADGHPGEPINCRCTAEPLLPGESDA